MRATLLLDTLLNNGVLRILEVLKVFTALGNKQKSTRAACPSAFLNSNQRITYNEEDSNLTSKCIKGNVSNEQDNPIVWGIFMDVG